MFKVYSIRIATAAALGALSVLWGAAWAEQAPQAGAAATLEVKVLEAQVPPRSDQENRAEVLYRMKVISVLHSSIRVKPGDTIIVRASASGIEALDQNLKPRGWIGTAYLNPDPTAVGPDARSRFVGAANGDSFAELPPTPPSVRWIEYPREGTK